MKQWWLLAILSVFAATQAQAEPQFARMYLGKYSYAPACNACHRDGGGSPLNPYGEAFKDAKKTIQAFDAIAAKDSDGDGFANGEEILVRSNPGSDKSTPKAKGNWLDTANLIPKEVQKAYPGVTSYKRLDAVLTVQETADAKAMGVTVTARDENTIYVPIKDNRPLGTAIIVPGEYQDKSFFLLVATNPKLGITQVAPVNTKNVPEVAQSKIFATFNGANAAKIPIAKNTGSVDGAITNAVKKAGVILYVRLKKE